MSVISNYFKKINTNYTMITALDEIGDDVVLLCGEVVILNDGVHNEKCKIGDGIKKFSELPWFADVSEVTAGSNNIQSGSKFVNKAGEVATGTMPTAKLNTPTFSAQSTTHTVGNSPEFPAIQVEAATSVKTAGYAPNTLASGSSTIKVYLTTDTEYNPNTAAPRVSFSINTDNNTANTAGSIDVSPLAITVYVSADMTATDIQNAVTQVYNAYPDCKVVLAEGTKVAKGLRTFKGSTQTAPYYSYSIEINTYYGANYMTLRHNIAPGSMTCSGYHNANSENTLIQLSTSGLSIKTLYLKKDGHTFNYSAQGYQSSAWETRSQKTYLSATFMGLDNDPGYCFGGLHYWGTGYAGPAPGTVLVDSISFSEDVILPKVLGDWILANSN